MFNYYVLNYSDITTKTKPRDRQETLNLLRLVVVKESPSCALCSTRSDRWPKLPVQSSSPCHAGVGFWREDAVGDHVVAEEVPGEYLEYLLEVIEAK